MNYREKSRLDRFAFALGSFGIAISYAAVPVVANDRIAAAWDERLGAESDRPGHDPARSRFGWAT
jgi:hypothetical protein